MVFSSPVLVNYTGRLRDPLSVRVATLRGLRGARARLEKDNIERPILSRFILVGCFP